MKRHLFFKTIFYFCLLSTLIFSYEVGKRLSLIIYNIWKFSDSNTHGTLMVSIKTQYLLFPISFCVLFASFFCMMYLKEKGNYYFYSKIQTFTLTTLIGIWTVLLFTPYTTLY